MLNLSISKEELSTLPQAMFDGEIIVIDTLEHIKEAVDEIRNAQIVGFDTETRPAFRKGLSYSVSLIQISTFDKCYLFRINKIGFNSYLKEIIEDENIVKIGLSLRDDMRLLRKISDFAEKSFIDLQPFVKDYAISDNSLQRIYGIIFKEKISKGQRLSNWEAAELSLGQRGYAATDAWACLKIYDELTSKHFNPLDSQYVLVIDEHDNNTEIYEKI